MSATAFSQKVLADEARISSKMEQRAAALKSILSSGEGEVSSVYIYTFTRNAYKKNPQRLAARLSLLGFTDVYVEVPYGALNINTGAVTIEGKPVTTKWDEEATEWFADFNIALKEYDIKSHAQMFGTWELFSKYWVTMRNMECALFNQYQKEVKAGGEFDGVAADIEAHATGSASLNGYAGEFRWRWDNTNGWIDGTNVNDTMMQHTYDLLKNIREQIGNEVRLDQATNWVMQKRVNKETASGFLNTGNSTGYIDNGCNTISVMSYWETKEETWNRFKPSLVNLSGKDSKYDKTGICTIDVYANEGEKYITLYTKGWDYVLEAIEYIQDMARSGGYNAYGGIAVFDYSGLESLWQGESSLYSEGALTIMSSGDSTKVFVAGDFIAGTNQLQDNVTTTCDLLLNGNARAILAGDFRHNALVGKVFNTTKSDAIFEFRGAGHQEITTDGTNYTTIPHKANNYIAFPQSVIINNSKHVTMDPSLGAEMNLLELDKGWLILDSREAKLKDYDPSLSSADKDTTHATVFAHLNVQAVNYNNSQAESPDERGFVQVNMQLDNRTWGAAENYTEPYRSLVGFGIPFQQMRADYFMFNFLVAPTHSSFFGDSRTAIIDPRETLVPGRGYGLGIDLRGTNQEDYRDIGRWVPVENFEYRVNGDPMDEEKGKYMFNRNHFAQSTNVHSPNQLFGSDEKALSHDAYALERLNVGDVQVTLDKASQYYYVSNPFMAPLDVTDIVENNLSAWGTSSLIENTVWIMTGSTSMGVAAYEESRMKVVYNFEIAQYPGGTYTGLADEDDDKVTIAPLQMFVLKSKEAGKLTIPAANRTMGTTKFVKSLSRRYDDFIFEVSDLGTGISDRVSLVLRPALEIAENPGWGNIKKLKTRDSNLAFPSEESLNPLLPQNVFSQIYTRDADHAPNTVQFFPLETTTTVPLYLTPATEPQQIKIRGLRLQSMREVEAIYLEDKLEEKIVQMTPETVYFTTSNPDDRLDRFVLHFGEVQELEEPSSDIWAYYENGVLTVSGFNEEDFGSVIYLYTAVGAQFLQAKVDNHTLSISTHPSSGIYVLRVDGKRKATLKIRVN